MPLSKKHLFTEELQLTAAYGHVISHPARILSLQTLAEYNCVAFRDFTQLLPLSETTVSNHLRTLERHHLIVHRELPGHIAGYALHHPTFEEAVALLTDCLRVTSG